MLVHVARILVGPYNCPPLSYAPIHCLPIDPFSSASLLICVRPWRDEHRHILCTEIRQYCTMPIQHLQTQRLTVVGQPIRAHEPYRYAEIWKEKKISRMIRNKIRANKTQSYLKQYDRAYTYDSILHREFSRFSLVRWASNIMSSICSRRGINMEKQAGHSGSEAKKAKKYRKRKYAGSNCNECDYLLFTSHFLMPWNGLRSIIVKSKESTDWLWILIVSWNLNRFNRISQSMGKINYFHFIQSLINAALFKHFFSFL